LVHRRADLRNDRLWRARWQEDRHGIVTAKKIKNRLLIAIARTFQCLALLRQFLGRANIDLRRQRAVHRTFVGDLH
jgi:hypothetical protein